MGKRRSSSASAPEVEEAVTPLPPAKRSGQLGMEPNSSSTMTPQGTVLAPGTMGKSPFTADPNSSSKKAKSTQEITPVTVRRTTSGNKKQSTTGGSRRSSRLRNAFVTTPRTTPTEQIQFIISDITGTDSEKEEDEQPTAVEAQVEKDPVAESGDVGEKTREELVALCEAQQKTIAELKAEVLKNANSSENPSDLKYKSLYIDSKKEVDALTKEAHKLRMDLEFARGRSVGVAEAMMITMFMVVARDVFRGQQSAQ